MKRLFATLIALCVLTPAGALAGALNDAEIAHVSSEIKAMIAAFQQGNPEELINRTHPSLYALRRVGDTEWKYLDGAGLRNHPDLLSQRLPELDPKVEYPENTIEAL